MKNYYNIFKDLLSIYKEKLLRIALVTAPAQFQFLEISNIDSDKHLVIEIRRTLTQYQLCSDG